MFALWSAVSHAGPDLNLYQGFAAAAYPTGVLSDSRASARWWLAPGSQSILFRDNHLDLGGRISVSPAFVELGPRIEFSPVAVFDLTVQGTVIRYISPRFGTMAYAPDDSTLGPVKNDKWRDGEGFTAWGRTLQVSPALKGRVWEIVFFSSWNISYIQIDRPDGIDSDYLFEPYRGTVIAWTDTAVEHLSAVLWEPLDGEDGPLFRVGGAIRGKWAGVSPDRSLTAGLVVMARPGTAPAVPTFTGVLLPYLIDGDRVGKFPFAALIVEWSGVIDDSRPPMLPVN
ncbi:MAG: hypothetical protein ABMB14_23910 [Myxococcota bacterium]